MAGRADTPSPAALRSRRWRARERKGLVCSLVDLDGDLFWALEIAGLKTGADKAEIRAALNRALREWANEKISQRVTLTAMGRR